MVGSGILNWDFYATPPLVELVGFEFILFHSQNHMKQYATLYRNLSHNRLVLIWGLWAEFVNLTIQYLRKHAKQASIRGQKVEQKA